MLIEGGMANEIKERDKYRKKQISIKKTACISMFRPILVDEAKIGYRLNQEAK